MSIKTSILGSGAMATAIAILLSEKEGQEITLWARTEQTAQQLRQSRTNSRQLPGFQIPESVQITHDPAVAARDADYLVISIPSQYLRSALSQFQPFLVTGQPAISVVKGIENDTFLRPSQIIEETIGRRGIVALTGPSHAEEIARRMPASVVAASPDLALAEQVQDMFSTDRFRVYTNQDLIGAELAGALKNIIGIAAGISDGLGYGDNAKSALMTRGIVEITRLGISLGAEPETFAGLAGIGDLITTCISPFGRNRAVGIRLGKGESLNDILQSMGSVAEGVSTARAVHYLCQQKGIEMPITEAVYQVLFEGLPPRDATDRLMSRPTRRE
jgi:Glycerol-3-phosphate dehydrogenase